MQREWAIRINRFPGIILTRDITGGVSHGPYGAEMHTREPKIYVVKEA